MQNAEDAKASEIHFILDERTHADGSVFQTEEGKQSFQQMQVLTKMTNTVGKVIHIFCKGPSLFVYNNATFSAQDWTGIVSPRMGSKKKDSLEKVGKFGLGFSSVYHITGI